MVLDAGGGPERALRLSSEPGQLLPSLAGDVAGYSLGAWVSLELATRGRIRSVVAIAPDGLELRWSGFTRRRR